FLSHTYSAARTAEGTGDGFSVKTDWYLAEHHSFTTRYNFSDDRSVLPFTSDAINSSLATRTRTQNLSLFFNSTRPGFANALRVSYGRTHLRFPEERSRPLIFGSPPVATLAEP